MFNFTIIIVCEIPGFRSPRAINYCFLQFALLESSSVDDDLANLKKELSGGSKVSFK